MNDVKKDIKHSTTYYMNIYLYGVFGWDNSRGWFIYLENLKFFVMKYFVWIEKWKSI